MRALVVPLGGLLNHGAEGKAMAKTDPFPRIRHEVDFCVVGGGMAGICAALAAARLGARNRGSYQLNLVPFPWL